MSLRHRLQSIAAGTGTKPAPERDQPPLEALVDGDWIDVSGSRCFVVERLYPVNHRHGNWRLSDLFSVPVEAWSLFATPEQTRDHDPRRALFLDVETTGLAPGAGTVAFLVGVGFFQDDHYCVRQYFMPDYADEDALLELLANDLDAENGLVTFNGRSYDWPLLRTRYAMNRRALSYAGEAHLDLLPLSRRLWRHRLPSCALASLEGHVLGIERDGLDVPGYLIPSIYSEYVRTGQAQPMAGIFYHNAVDILSMVTLAARIGHMAAAPFDLEDDPYCDFLAIGRIYEDVGRSQESIRAYRMAEQRGTFAQTALARKRLSSLLKRLGRYDEAMALWRLLLNGTEIYPYIELAKQLEHRLGDYAAAKTIIVAGIEAVRSEGSSMMLPLSEHFLADLTHRLNRVERRIVAAQGRDAPIEESPQSDRGQRSDFSQPAEGDSHRVLRTEQCGAFARADPYSESIH